MPKIILTDEEKIKLLEAVNAGVEPSPDLLPKLFPGTAEKFDVRALDRAKLPTLEYSGKRSKAAILAEAGAGIGAAPLQVARSFGEVKEGEWQNLIVQGDNLQFLKTCYRDEDPIIKGKVKGKVKLIYIDPPFATKSDFGGKEGEKSYSDKVASAEFIEGLRNRLLYLKELLDQDGCIYLHLDQKMSHYSKIILDEVFGRENFRNEIVWKRTRAAHSDATYFGKVHDVIYYYGKTPSKFFNNQYSEHREKYLKRFSKIDENNRKYMLIPLHGPGQGVARSFFGKMIDPPNGRCWPSQKVVDEYTEMNLVELTSNGTPSKRSYLDVNKGSPVSDWWEDIIPLNPVASERLNYPTQKPETLLQRIISTSSNPGDLILDCFAGSGTTPSVAEKLDRRWIACDFGKHSIYTIQKRILHIGDSEKFGVIDIDDVLKCDDCESIIEEAVGYKKCKKCGCIVEKEVKPIKEKYNQEAKPFSVVSAGAYDFSHVMALGNPEHKDAYIAFVLGLFQLGRDEEKAKKFKLTNIFADKDGSPVEVYPVWDERYLKEVRIDEEYLQEIINQAGGRLSGEYHIITPEHCTNVGDTILKNSEGKNVTFKFLTFPYKVLEDASRHFELHEQPASQSAVNELITSTAFYFNEDVEIEVVRSDKGLAITKFDTKILNKDGNRFPELEGLAMLLVDIDHEQGKPFDMDKTIFAKDIKEDGTFPVEDISDKTVAVIAIDKHGNESKPFVVK